MSTPAFAEDTSLQLQIADPGCLNQASCDPQPQPIDQEPITPPHSVQITDKTPISVTKPYLLTFPGIGAQSPESITPLINNNDIVARELNQYRSFIVPIIDKGAPPTRSISTSSVEYVYYALAVAVPIAALGISLVVTTATSQSQWLGLSIRRIVQFLFRK